MNTTNHAPIKLRWDRKSDGRESAYLDYYISGKRTKEFLKLYRGGSIPSRESRTNERLAEAILARRTTEYMDGLLGIRTQHSHILLHTYYNKCASQRIGNNQVNWHSAWSHIADFDPKVSTTMTLADISTEWCNHLISYLTTEARTKARQRGKEHKQKSRAKQSADRVLSHSTARQTYAKLRACIHQAMREGIIDKDPTVSANRIKKTDGKLREYLSVEEVKLLSDTPCANETVKRAFLFSCLTGMRISDIRQLRWGMLHRFGDYWRIDFRQIKTKGQMYLDIPDVAVSYLGERQHADDLIFQNLLSSYYLNIHIRNWVKTAGIERTITMHCARHTAAVTLLSAGAGIYTVKEILGHTSLEATQIYGKIIDKTRQEAMSSLASLYADSTDNTRTITAKNGKNPQKS